MAAIMSETPFSTSPNPASLYLTSNLRSTLHKIRYVIDRRQGLTCVLGDVGMGKSTLTRLLVSEYQAREDAIVCFVPTPSYSSDFAFLKGICADLGLPAKRSLFDQEQALHGYLMEQIKAGKNVIVFLDEAQKLNGKMLEQVRGMLNFETNKAKMIQLVLAGQLELRDRLRSPDKRALRSRIFAPSILDALSLEETHAMIAHRCQWAAIRNPFPPQIIDSIYHKTAGVPREILKLCAMSYEMMNLTGSKEVTDELLDTATDEAILT
jgi:general secretion pathway protein A